MPAAVAINVPSEDEDEPDQQDPSTNIMQSQDEQVRLYWRNTSNSTFYIKNVETDKNCVICERQSEDVNELTFLNMEFVYDILQYDKIGVSGGRTNLQQLYFSFPRAVFFSICEYP